MKDLSHPFFVKYRNIVAESKTGAGFDPAKFGIFTFPSPVDGIDLGIIASTGEGWDHVSISREDRCPMWGEMEIMRRVFFKENETVMQLHPPMAQYIDGSWPGGRSLNCLHLWRPQRLSIPRPPMSMVGARSLEEAKSFLGGDRPMFPLPEPDPIKK